MSILFGETTYEELENTLKSEISKNKKLQKRYEELEKEVDMLRKWKKAHEETHYNEFYEDTIYTKNKKEIFDGYHDVML